MIYRNNIEKIKKKKSVIMRMLNVVVKILFNRIFYVALALLIQLVWIFLIAAKFVGYSQYISMALEIVTIVVVLWIVNQKINPSYKLAWTMLILCIPVFGVLLYLLFGQSRIATVMEESFEKILAETREYLKENVETREALEKEDLSASRQSLYIKEYSGYPLNRNTEAEYFQAGDDMFRFYKGTE